MQPRDKGFTLLQLVERPFHDVGFQLQTAHGACFTGFTSAAATLRARPSSGAAACA